MNDKKKKSIEYLNRRLLGESSEGNVTTLADILKEKGDLSQLKGLYLRVLNGPFTEKKPDYVDSAATFLFYNGREGMVGVELADGNNTNLYPKELKVDVDRFNAY